METETLPSKDTPKLVKAITKLKNKRGLILAKDVVEEARKENSELHKYFCWDNSEAGEKYRLIQAATLIRACVTYLDNGEDEKTPVRAFVSLRDDRMLSGGYRPIVEVLSDVDFKSKLLQDAMFELHVFEEKYQRISELKPIFKARKEVEDTVDKKRK